MELIRRKHNYNDKITGETKVGYNFYLVQNGVWVAVKCCMKEDYKTFKMLSSEEL